MSSVTLNSVTRVRSLIAVEFVTLVSFELGLRTGAGEELEEEIDDDVSDALMIGATVISGDSL